MNSKLRVAVWLPLLVALGFLEPSTAARGSGDSLTIGNYLLVSAVRATLYEYAYTYTADVTNAGPDAPGVTATLSSLSPYTKVVDGSLTFGDVPAASTRRSVDTFTIRQDRRYPFDQSKLIWAISSAPANHPPVANAGPDQTTPTGSVVHLNASASSDADGDPLTYSWAMVSRPAGSAAALSDPAVVNPTFIADTFGTYTIELRVNDGAVNSAPDSVTVSTVNTPPVANAGPDQSAFVTQTVHLNGAASSDIDGNPLTYAWSMVSRPAGSTAVLSDPGVVNPTFVVDRPGAFVVQLVVNDGFVSSAPDEVTIATVNSPPVADAGPNQTATPPATVVLSGAGSIDADGNALTFAWSLLSKPAGSGATLATPTQVTTSLDVDLQGEYVVQLVVNDGLVDSVPDTVTVSTSNSPPVANAGPDQADVPADATVHLNGSGSTDADGNPLTYAWSLLSKPAGSAAELSGANTVIPTFVADEPGTYVAQLVVNDGQVNSAPDTVSITVTDRLLDLPGAQELALGQTFDFTVLIAPEPAPAGGLQITLASSNPSLVQVLTPTVIVAEGSFQTTASIRASASAVGTATVTASSSGFASDDMQVPVTAAFNILQTISQFGVAETDTLHLQLESAGVPYVTPTPVAVTLSSSHTACAAVTSPTTIGAGASIGTATVSYGGSATTPCTATVTASSPLFGTDTVQVTIGQAPDLGAMTLTDPWYGAYRVGASLQMQMRLTLATASHGGITVQVESSVPSVARVASSATAPGTPVAEFTIPDGQTYHDFYVQGVRGSIGGAVISARAARFTPANVAVQVVAPVFRLYDLATSTTTLSADDEFYVHAGILNTSGTGIWFWQTASGAGPLPVTFTSGNGAVGQLKTTGTSGASVTVQIPVNREYTSTSVAAGGVAFDALSAGTTVVRATAPGFNNAWSEASATVTVTQPGMTLTDPWYGAYRVGAGLQTQVRLTLGGANHGGVTVRVTSSNPSAATLAATGTVPGTPFIDLVIADGQTYKDFYVQGVQGAAGAVTLTATQALFSSANVAVQVVAPVFRLYDLDTNTTTLSADDEFYAYAGVLNTSGTGIWFWQPVSGAGPVTVTFASSNAAVGRLKTTATTGAAVTVQIPVNREYTSTSVATGGVAFDALSAGTTVVSATAPGFNNAWSEASATVTVTQPGMTLTDPWVGAYRVGASLQAQVRLTLGGANHGGVTVRVTSSNPSAATLAATGTVPGTPFVDLFIADGQTYRDFYVQGVQGATGTVTLTATQALFTNGTVSVQVVQPVFRLYDLATSTTTLSADDEFYVYAGILNTAGTGVWTWQAASGAGPVTVTFASSNPAVGQVKTASASGAAVTVQIPVNQSYSPTNVAAGGVAFDPLSGGTTAVTATAPGFNNSWAEASATVTVTQPGMTLTDPWFGAYRVGAGLQTQVRLTLGGANHGGVTVRVTSSSPSVATVAATATVAGTPFVDLFIADGQTYKDFYVQGVQGAAGAVTLTVTQALFSSANVVVQVVAPVFRLYNLDTNTTTLSADDEFYAYAGVLNTSGTAIWFWQPVSGAGPVTVTFASSNAAVGRLKTTATTGAAVTVQIPVNREYTSTSVATGGVAFDALSAGTTVVSATAPGFNNAWSEASATVTVTQPGMTMTDPWVGAYRVGASLQTQVRLTLGGANHGGVTVRVASSDHYRALVSPNATTAGTPFIDVYLPDGTTYKDFYVQGVQGVTGTVTLTATQALFTDGTVSFQVVAPVFRLYNLDTNTTTLSADDEFYVFAGILNTAGTGVLTWQAVSGAGPVTVLFTSSNPSVGQLKTTSATGASVTVQIPVNQEYSPTSVAAGGVALDGLSVGTTVVRATAVGFNDTWSESAATITVSAFEAATHDGTPMIAGARPPAR
jgi:hypothetical protein